MQKQDVSMTRKILPELNKIIYGEFKFSIMHTVKYFKNEIKVKQSGMYTSTFFTSA